MNKEIATVPVGLFAADCNPLAICFQRPLVWNLLKKHLKIQMHCADWIPFT